MYSVNRRGSSLLYILLALAAMVAICSLAVDYGRVQCAKTELRRAADAAARAAIGSLSSGATTARTNAINIAAANTVDGTALVLQSGDIQFGTWNTTNRTFTALPAGQESSANAVQITAQRTAARGNAIQLIFAQVIGQRTCDVQTVSVAYKLPGQAGGFIGLGSITAKNNVFVASYNSSVTTSPSHSNYTSNGGLGSNGTIDGGNNNTVNGTVGLGPSGTINGFSVTGSTNTLSSAIPTPTLPAWSPGINPGGITQNYSTSSDTTLVGGTYWFTSLSVTKNNSLTFSGPSTVYVNGNVTIDDQLAPSSKVPSDLTIYQYGNGTFGDSSNNSITVIAKIIAPGVDFSAKNNCTLMGSATFDTMTFKNNADIYYDTSMGGASSSSSIQTVK